MKWLELLASLVRGYHRAEKSVVIILGVLLVNTGNLGVSLALAKRTNSLWLVESNHGVAPPVCPSNYVGQTVTERGLPTEVLQGMVYNLLNETTS